MYRVLVIALCAYVYNSVNADLSWTSTESTIHTLKDQNITLECVAGSSEISVKWKDTDGLWYFMDEVKADPDVYDYFGRYNFEVSDFTYKMKISNVAPADDGTFQCIATNKLVQGETASEDIDVNVFVKPGRPQIEGLGGVTVEPSSPHDAVSTVSIPQGMDEAQIKCIVGPAKPAIPIKWYKDDVIITSNISPVETTLDDENLETTSNILTISDIKDNMNGDQYKCLADLTAISAPAGPVESTYKVFNLSIHSPPSDPIIDTAQDNTREPGDVVTLKCTTIGGNPLPSLTWYRNDEVLSIQYETYEADKKVESELIVIIKASDNNAKYRCEAKNPSLEKPKNKTIIFQVRFPPEMVTITGNNPVKAGESTILSCTTSNSNPQSEITWYSRGSEIPRQNYTIEVKNSTEGGYITQANITVHASRSNYDADYSCRASHPLVTGFATENINLDVLYPPDLVEITGFDSSNAAKVETLYSMTCTSEEGNPLPDLLWYRNGKCLLYIEDNKRITSNLKPVVTNGKTRSLELLMVTQAEDNGAIYKCSAKSDATASPVREDSVQLAVHFPPQDVVITPTEAMKEGVRVTLTCNSGTSYPQSKITWFKNETQVYVGVEPVAVEDGSYGGKVTISSFTFTPQAGDNGLVVQCSARNEQILRTTTQTLPLDVLHKPIFVGVRSHLNVQEGKNFTDIDFSASGNPSEITYTWFTVVDSAETELQLEAKRDGAVSELKVSGGVLSIHNINRARAGKYRVKATNSEGSTSSDFNINVQYGAGIPDAPTQTYEDGTLKLHCVIDSNPVVDIQHARWTRLDYDMSRTSQTVSDSGNRRTLTLTIPNVIRDDIGTFTCEANNTFGTVTKEYTVTVVPFSPEIDKRASISKSAARTQEDGIIKCKIAAYPQPTVAWSKSGAPIEMDDIKYSMAIDTEGQMLFSFALNIINVGEEDYGTYTCFALNDEGSDTHDYKLTGTSKPDAPTDIEVLNITDTTVILTWALGFDGGLAQQFTVRYHIPTDSPPVILYADAPATPFTLDGLRAESTYEFTVQAFNELGKSEFQKESVSAMTQATPTALPTVTRPEEPMFIVIMALAVVGGLLLIVTTVLICVFVRRRRKRNTSEATDSTSQTNTVDLYGTHDGSYYNDDAKSYSAYEKSLDNDDAKHYDTDSVDNHMKHVNDTYISLQPVSPSGNPASWTKEEDPLGNSGTYGRLQQSMASVSTTDKQYVQNVRHADRTLHYQQPLSVAHQPLPLAHQPLPLAHQPLPLAHQPLPLAPYQRPDFVRDRPKAPRPPGRIADISNIYSSAPSIPERNYSPLLPISPTPDSMKGDLV